MAGCPEGILVDVSEPVMELCLTEMPDLFPDPVAVSPPRPMDIVGLEDPCHNSGGDDSPAEDKPSLDSVEFIDEEVYDFNLPGTPTTSSAESADSAEDEEEVFFGAVSHMERCIATAVNSVTEPTGPMSPLNSHQFAEIYKEANKVAFRISSASGTRKRKAVGKGNLTCVKQLSLGAVINKRSPRVSDKLQTTNCPSPVGNLMKSVSQMKVDVGDKENCDMLEAGSRVNDRLVDVEKQVNGNKEIPSEGSDMKRHIRSKTYLVNNIPDSLPSSEKRKSVPVIDMAPSNEVCAKKIKLNKDEKKRHSEVGAVTKMGINNSKFYKDEEKSHSKGAAEPPKKRSISRLQKPKVTSGPIKQPAVTLQKKPVADEVSMTSNEVIKPRSRLSAPTAGIILSATSVPTSKLKLIGQQPTQTKPAIPAVKGLVPASKLQPLKPSGLMRRSSFQQKTGEGIKRVGPLKAFAPVTGQKGNKPEPAAPLVTPLKANTQVQRKNLMSSRFTSGNESRTAKVPESPSSSVAKRRSFLPTPTKTGSGSLSSPGRSSTSSTYSQESPLVPGTTSIGKYGRLDFSDESSPSVLRPRRQLVTNTPNKPVKKRSPWSPIERRKPQDHIEQAIMCTKKTRNSICPQ